ncbi:MAG: hypothetical protein K8R31_03120 [Bacteroidales bacterium]|nr:hypothetical protein [Bacteroidales bacterium]
MENKTKIIQWVLIISITMAACNLKQNEPQVANPGSDENFIVIADTIVNDVIIMNPDNDEWTEYCLRNLDKKTLVDEIFKSVYAGELIPYEFFQNEILSIKDIKALENDSTFSRDKIARVQFEEAWHYNPVNQKMVKKVHSIMLAYEIYNSLGEIKGYKPAFKVYFK